MHRQNTDYYISTGMDLKLAKIIRHQRYVNTREHYHTVSYYDNMLSTTFQPDLQLIALKKALARMRIASPVGYNILLNFYFDNYCSIKSYADKNNISRQAMSKKIKEHLYYLRILAYDELNKLYLDN